MTELEQFQQFIYDKTRDCRDLWTVAHEEYASDSSVTFNFAIIAGMLKENANTPGITSYEVAAVYLMKHIFSLVRDHSARESMTSRFTDAHNYLFIMEWMLRPQGVSLKAASAADDSQSLLDRLFTIAENDAIAGKGLPEPYLEVA